MPGKFERLLKNLMILYEDIIKKTGKVILFHFAQVSFKMGVKIFFQQASMITLF